MLNLPLIAIDIGSSSIKVCELDRTGSRLKRLGLELFESNVILDGEIKEPEIVRDILISMFKRMKISTRGRRTSLALSGSGIMIKRSLFAGDQEADIYEQAAYEASQAFPFEPDDLYLRFAMIGPANAEGRTPMALIGAKREVVEQHIALTHAIGLKTGVIDCSALATANMFDHNYPVDGAMVIVANIGATTTQVVITYNGEFLYTRDITIGGKDYNQKIMDDLGVDFENAENLKIASSLVANDATEDMIESLNQVNEVIAREIETTINYFFESEEVPHDMPRQGYIFLVGGSARVLGLDATVAATIHMPVQVVNPFQRINTKSSPYEAAYLMNQGTLFGTSVGLALRKFRDHT